MKFTVGHLFIVVISAFFLFKNCLHQTSFHKSTQVTSIQVPSETSQATISEDRVNIESCKTITDYNREACIKFANHCGQMKEWAKKGVISEPDPSIDKCKSKGCNFDD